MFFKNSRPWNSGLMKLSFRILYQNMVFIRAKTIDEASSKFIWLPICWQLDWSPIVHGHIKILNVCFRKYTISFTYVGKWDILKQAALDPKIALKLKKNDQTVEHIAPSENTKAKRKPEIFLCPRLWAFHVNERP